MSDHGGGSGGGQSGSDGSGNSSPNGDNLGHGGGNPGHGGANAAHIIVDNQPKTVRQGEWLVSALKQEVGVDPAKALAEITPTGLVDLEDTAHIDVRDGLRFMSHVRKGGSS
ncbi:hypothetical protein [Bradyrhizobium sp. WSM1743]|uniref:hypothetical protein n=1 Tax=Bradyrhizobium sp. WSM1743 TaxID=318996 RepID=UPI00040719DD|nr:hypothetical protein [Bradyrhizobium sp. WSM1743]